MPFSSISGKSWMKRLVLRLIHDCKNKSILDVGAGAGTYSDLLRTSLPEVEFTGIEIWEPYISEYQLNEKYDHLIRDDIRTLDPTKRYGIVILGDVLEHMTKEEAIDVYNKLLRSAEFVIISIPIIYYPQGEYAGNPYEKHVKDDWNHAEVLDTFSHLAVSHIENELGVYVGFNPEIHRKETVQHANHPFISVYGIYKNEQKCIRRFLESVKEADEIVLCDTGSSDQTNEIIREFKKQHENVQLNVYSICVSPWRFDDARNTALSFVHRDADLCISLDMDEYLMNDWKTCLYENWTYGVTRYTHHFRTIWPNGGMTEHLHERIHLRTGYTWKLPVHEILEYRGQEMIMHLPDFWIIQEPDEEKDRSSYLPLLEQSVKERKDVWKSWSFLASEYINAGRYEDALAAVDTALQLEQSDKAYLHKLKFVIYKAQNDVESALHSLNQALFYLPQRRELYFEKAMYLHDLNRNVEAYFTLKEAEQKTLRVIDYHYNPLAWDDSFTKWITDIQSIVKKEGILP